MSVYTRSDKYNFVLQPYRETLKIKNANILKKEIRLLAKSNGFFIRLIKQPGPNYEAIFSRDPGQLLGESVWQHFHKPNHMIFLEAVENNDYILVVILDSKVLIDSRLEKKQLLEEIQNLTDLNYSFLVVQAHDSSFPIDKHLSPSQISKTETFKVSVLENLIIDTKLTLLPIEQALKLQKIGHSRGAALTGCLIVLIASFIGFKYWKQPDSYLTVENPANPYQFYLDGLKKPAPELELITLMNHLERLKTLLGWEITSVNDQGQQAVFILHSFGGNLTQLYHWMREQQIKASMTSQGIKIEINLDLPVRKDVQSIYNAQHIVALIVDRLMRLLPGKAVEINSIDHKMGFQEIFFTVHFNDISPDVIKLVALQFRDMPVTLIQMSTTLKHGMLTGSISLKALGT